ncbi:hypothetical protein EOD41_15545 [Mucilaginibacter limnophilus]|uniref:Uncharacterized protein n=1 Tax=Mucilaginibacter limnophilus TaxID=1932778 RepID=A0A437MQD2_9SPHI|nr:hypothetical protein [Mucilaginibacter limnophilus]RVT99853.1 hypothetical protein EOD41_15545 [Mucilaginibacter limnophilus]
MKSIYVYNKYITCIHNAKSAFTQYEKYRHCYSIRSVDEEMQNIFRRIGLTYAKLIQVVALNKTGSAKIEPEVTNIIDECDNLLKDKHSFFDNIINYLDQNRISISTVLRNKLLNTKLLTDLTALENHLAYANKLVNRMELMLKSSQQIYRGSELMLKSA